MKCKPISTAILVALLAFPFIANSTNNNKNYGVTIADKDTYPLYKHSRIIKSNGTFSLLPDNNQDNLSNTVANLLKNATIPYHLISESPLVFQTEWIAWHYDADSKKTLSNQNNVFFQLNTRDKYKFTIAVTHIQQHPAITINKVEREQQVDITPDTAMVWLKWKQKTPDTEAVHAFLQRLQTENEILALESTNTVLIPVLPQSATIPIKKIHSNNIALNSNIEQSWALVIKQLKNKNVNLTEAHNDQHILNTDWLKASYNPDNNVLTRSVNSTQRHRFQIIIIPGSTKRSSSVLVYHTKSQTKTQRSNSDSDMWSDSETEQKIAAAFLNMLDL